jgi:putative oxidoreductase
MKTPPMKDLGLLILRVVAGVTLAAHGYPKLFGGPGKRAPKVLANAMGPNYQAAVERSGPGFVAALEKMGVPNPRSAAVASGVAELVGGLALAAGWFTRPAAFAVAANMAVASYKAHWKNGFYGQGGYEFSLLLGTVALSLGLTGPGRISIDHLMSAEES